MVSFWPWKVSHSSPLNQLYWPRQGEDNSPAPFEKSLSALSTKITETTSRLDSNRQTARRFKAIWTLYAIFAYTLYTIAVALLVGWENYGLKEIPALVGGPVMYAPLCWIMQRSIACFGWFWQLWFIESTPSAPGPVNASITGSRGHSDISKIYKKNEPRRSRSLR